MTREQLQKLHKYAAEIGVDSHAFVVCLFIGVDCCKQPMMVESYGTIATSEIDKWKTSDAFC